MAEHVISSITYRDDTYLLKNAVLMRKTFENVIATANNIDNATFYFGKIVADSWDVPLRIRYRVKAYCPDNKNYNQYADVSYFIIRNTAAYCVENVVYSTSYRAAYYHNLYRATQAGSTGYGHLLGESLYASTNPLDTKLKRTFEFEILEMENCTFEFFESPVLYKDAPGTGSTNYTGRSDYYFHVSGLYPDNNTVTQTLIASRLMADKNGVKQYSIMYETKDGKVESLTSGSGTGTAKTWNTNAKIPYPPRLYYYSGSSNVANDSYIATSATYINISTIDMRYSDNITTTVGYTMNKPLYLECSIDTDGYFTIGESPYKQTFTKGKYYIFIGWVHTAVYTLSFFNAHDVYYYDGTNLIPYEQQAYAKKDHTHNYVPNTKEGVSAAINLLDVSEVTPGSDKMYVVTAQASNVGDEYFRRPIGSLWDYFKDCISLRKENSGSVVKDIVYNSTEAKFTVTMTDMVGEVDATVGATYHGEIFNVYSGSNINKATGQYSHAEGINTSATAYATHAEGSFTTVGGSSSHGEGYGTKTTNDYAHAEGYVTEANGYASHAEGYYAKANGYYTHAEGYYTEATGNYSHVEGYYAKAQGQYSHAEGNASITTKDYAHAEGTNTKAMAEASHTEGRNTVALGYTQGMHAEGYGNSQLPSSITISSSTDDILTAWKINKGYDSSKFSLASGNGAHVEGYSTLAFNDGAHAEGYMTFAQNTGSHAEGEYTRAVNSTTHAEGYGTTASGNCSHAEGYSNIVASKALWSETTANILADWETARKKGISYAYTMARGDYSHTEGFDTLGLGIGSHAEGGCTVANGNYSHTEGYWTYAMSDYQHVEGKYNVKDTSDKFAFIIGNGTSDDARSNLFAIGWDGKLYINNATEGVDITVDKDTKYTGGTGITIGTDNVVNHSNSVTAVTTAGFYKLKYDAQGHVTGTTAVAKADITALGIPGSDTNTTYTLTQDATDGHKLTFTPSSGTATTIIIPDNNTTYSAGTGLSLSGTTFNHSNSIAAITTAAFKKFTYDAQGHITGSSAVAASDLPAHTHSYIAGHSQGTRLTSANLPTATNGNGAIFGFVATSTMTEGKPPTVSGGSDAHILQMNWDNSGGWDSQIAVYDQKNSFGFRSQSGGTWGNWAVIYADTSSGNKTYNLDTLAGKSTVSISRSLTSGTKIATITIDGTATDLYCQTDTNTDTKVRQTLSTANEKHPILMGYSQTSDTTANVDNVSYRNNSVYVNPSTGTVGATKVNIAEKVVMQYDSVNECLEFVF